MSYGRSITMSMEFDQAVTATKEALKEQGFGVLSEIDVAATLADKLGVEREPLVILGACNPELANRALDIEPQIALLLPCNVVVRRQGTETVIEAIDPAMLVGVTANPKLEPVAGEAADRLAAALASLAAREEPGGG